VTATYLAYNTNAKKQSVTKTLTPKSNPHPIGLYYHTDYATIRGGITKEGAVKAVTVSHNISASAVNTSPDVTGSFAEARDHNGDVHGPRLGQVLSPSPSATGITKDIKASKKVSVSWTLKKE